MFINAIFYIAAFIVIWYGSGLIVSAASKFSNRLRLSTFAFSFVFLGLLTSIPEFSVGMQAVADNDPEIFIGNLLGGVIVLFLFVIPLLAIFGNGINLKHEMDSKPLLFTLAVIAAPSYFVLDKKVTDLEGGILIILYIALLYFIERKNGIFDKDNKKLLVAKAYSLSDIFKMLVGIILVFLSSNIIVEQTEFFADTFSISAFYISLIVIAIGTNLPELSLAIRSVISGQREVAMGDYLGSAAVNTVLFGLFTLLHKGEVITISSFAITFTFIITGLLLFYVFFSAKQFITRNNGIVLICLYVIFVILELQQY